MSQRPPRSTLLTHSVPTRRSSDLLVLFRGQADHRLHGRRPSLVSGKMSGPPVHSLRLQKIVIYYYLSVMSVWRKMVPPGSRLSAHPHECIMVTQNIGHLHKIGRATCRESGCKYV